MSIEELPHTADILLRVKAGSLEDLFAESVQALMGVMYGNARSGKDVQEIRVMAEDLPGLLVNFLSEILFVSESERFVVAGTTVSITGTSLEARLTGEKFIPEKHGGGMEVKGISYSGLVVEKTGDGYQADILFDV
ncbi:MAG: archease [Methanoregulaceae archaeon]